MASESAPVFSLLVFRFGAFLSFTSSYPFFHFTGLMKSPWWHMSASVCDHLVVRPCFPENVSLRVSRKSASSFRSLDSTTEASSLLRLLPRERVASVRPRVARESGVVREGDICCVQRGKTAFYE